MLRFSFQSMTTWPPAAWIACWSDESDEILVRHGVRVESHDRWFGEIVWDGDYAAAEFDQTDIVFGSGAKLNARGDLIFVSSASTLDRLHSMKIGSNWYVSNSLVCLMAVTQSSVDPTYECFHQDFMRILEGVGQHDHGLDTDNGRIRLTYFRNLSWNRAELAERDKPQIERQRNTLDEYHGFLESKINRIGSNLRDARRKHPFELMGTASTGYDSPTVAALGRSAGLKQVISITSSRSGKSDSGEEIAHQLGLEPILISRDRWRDAPLSEVPFLSVDAKGEDVYFRGAQDHLGGKVLLTGYCGSVWGGRSRNYFRMKRTDPSGLSLSEFRLWVGFINLPLALMGVYQAEDLQRLMASDQLSAWTRGGDYDKPFCRRVLSMAGVDDHLYGQEKKAASVLIEDNQSFLSEGSLADFQDYLSHSESFTRWKQARDQLGKLSRNAVGGTQNVAAFLGRRTGLSLADRYANSVRISEFANGNPQFKYLFPWAMEHAKQRYSSMDA